MKPNQLYSAVVVHPRFATISAIVLFLLFSLGLHRLEWNNSLENLHAGNSQEVRYHKEVSANFGAEAYLSLVLRSDDVNSKGFKNLGREFEQRFAELSGVRDVIGNSRLESAWERLSRERRGGGAILRDESAISALREAFLVNRPGTALAVHVVLRNGMTLDEQLAVLSEMRILTEEILSSSPVVPDEYYIAGTPVLLKELTSHMERDLFVLGPAAILVVCIVFFYFFRFLSVVVVPVVLGTVSIVATFGCLGWLGIPINFLASTIVLLIAVIGSTEDIHLLSGYADALRRGDDREKALLSLRRPLASALFLTSATTALGFLSIALVPVSGLRDFGLSCATGIVLNFVFTILLLPSIARLLPAKRVVASALIAMFPAFRAWILEQAFGRPGLVWLTFAVFTALCLVGLSKMDIQTDYVRFLSKDSPTAKSYKDFDTDFGGNRFYMVALETERKNGIYEPEALEALTKLDDFLKGNASSAVGLIDFIGSFRSGESGSLLDLDSDRGRANANSSVNRMLRAAGIPPFVDHDGSRTVFRVRTIAPGTIEMRRDISKIESFVAENIPSKYQVRVVGEEILITKFSEDITHHLLVNMLVVIVIATILLAAFFRSWLVGFFALVPNSFPLLAVFGVMGWFSIPLGTGTFAVAIVAVGISVDDSIHFLTRFLSIRRRTSRDEAISSTLAAEMKPVMATSLAMILGFLILAFSSLTVHKECGILFAVAVATALLADLFLNPVLLRIKSNKFSDPNGKIA